MQGPAPENSEDSASKTSAEDLGYVGDSRRVHSTARPVNAKIVSRQESTRAILALSLTVLLSAILIIALLRTASWEEAKQLLDLAVPAVTGLLGSAIGFYFGTKN